MTLRRRPRRQSREPKAQTATLTVEAVGAQGDGIAMLDGKPVYLPLTLPGDRVTARVAGDRGDVITLLEQAPRRDAACPHFGTCGGCALQHMPAEAYEDWKRRRIVDALARKGFEAPPLTSLAASPPHTRRRTTFTFENRGRTGRLGYHSKRSHSLVDIETCPVVTPAIAGLIGALKFLLSSLTARRGKVLITETDSGLDVLITGMAEPDLATREALTAFAQDHDFARLSILEDVEPGRDTAETIIQAHPPLLAMGGAQVPLAPGAFLQATKEGEAALVGAIFEWAEGPRIADLFAGGGTFSLPLADAHKVTAVENDAALLASLDRASGGRVATRERDLFEAPLMSDELATFDTVVIDPPRAGARAQAEAMAASPVGTVIAISCNPATFARDARTLVNGGYDLVEIRAVDQFLWSPHVELAALFKRE